MGRRVLLGILIALVLLLQLRFWFGPGSIEQRTSLQREIEAQRLINAEIEAANRLVEREIQAFQEQPDEAVEARAREDLGLIREGETFFLLPEDNE